MSERVQDYVVDYSVTKLEETARTFRRLGEAYETASESQKGGTGISKQLFLVADVLEECMTIHVHTEDVKKDFVKELAKKCFINGIRIKNVQQLSKKNGRNAVVMQARTVGRSCVVTRKLVLMLAEVLNCGYYSDDSNRRIINEEYHQYIFIREDRFKLLSGVARMNKGKSRFNGDNFLISRLECGKAIAAIADGMGSGRRACVESRMVIELMENCIEAGFDEKASIDLINSAYIAGGKTGNPVTMDMSVIDCQSGYMHCMKLGAVSTFIKRDKWVEIIQSTTLPMGVLEQVDYDCTTKKLYDGDYVVMVSDGVLDNIPCVDKEEKVAQIIHSLTVREPSAMAEAILEQSLVCNDMKASDDCTVLVLGLFDTYGK